MRVEVAIGNELVPPKVNGEVEAVEIVTEAPPRPQGRFSSLWFIASRKPIFDFLLEGKYTDGFPKTEKARERELCRRNRNIFRRIIKENI